MEEDSQNPITPSTPLSSSSLEGTEPSLDTVFNREKHYAEKAGLFFSYRFTLFYRALFVLYTLSQLFPDHFFIREGAGLDPSWKMALDLAFRKGLVWGKEFAFTYGPLGFLSGRLPTPSLGIWYFFSDLFILSQVAFLTWRLSALIKSPFHLAAAVGMVLFFGWSPFYIELPLLLFVLLFFWLLLFLFEGRAWSLVPACVNTVLAFYIKLNVGLFGIVLYLAALGISGIERRRWTPSLIGAGTLLGLLLLSLIVVPVSLGAYVVNSWRIASGFNETMGVTFPLRQSYLLLATTTLACWGGSCLALTKEMIRSWRKIFLYGSASLLLFILFKQGFVRADGHELSFFTFAPVVIAIGAYFSRKVKSAFLTRGTLAVAIGCSLPIWHEYLNIDFFKGQYRGIQEYGEERAQLLALQREGREYPLTVPPANVLSPTTLAQIGSAPVDVIPWDVSLLYFNHLNYTPRPVMQSYSAYTKELLTLNEEAYRAERAPKFVFLSNPCIDGRLCQAEDIGARKVVAEQYEVRGEEAGMMLLERLSLPRLTTERPLITGEGKTKKWIPIPEGEGITFLKAEVKYSLLGLLRLIGYKPPEVRLLLKFDNGEVRDFRAVRGGLSYGIPVSRLFESQEELKKFHQGEWKSLKKAVAFQIKTSSSFGLEEKFSYTLSDYVVHF